MENRSYSFLVGCLVCVITLVFFTGRGVAVDQCSDPIGTVISLQGDGQVRRDGQMAWLPAGMNYQLCMGDLFRVGRAGRAAIALSNETVLRVDQNTTLNLGAPDEGFSVLNVFRGVLHIFSHRPRALKIVTPYVNGAVEGTEFLVSVESNQATITVLEGMVNAGNSEDRVTLSSRQSVVARQGVPLVKSVVVNPRDAVQWTLYYPTILDRLTPVSGGTLITEAADYLMVGRVDEARSKLDQVLTADPGSAEALALLAIIEVVQGNGNKALDLAEKSIQANPRSAAAGLALSYARQARFDMEGTLAALEKTAEFNPDNAEVLARLAEIQLAVGLLDAALESASRAAELSVDSGRIQAVLGFSYLARVELEQAEAAFQKAISRDQVLPLARMGLGLTYIRGGNLEKGRGELEMAAALDPGNSLLRSYLGKAYFEERRNTKSRRQYDVARELDPTDPTPWFYDALRKQTVNRPVEALHDLQRSIELNDNRAVFRSRFLLDDDLAARSASLGRIYSDLGFQQLALVQGWRSAAASPANFSSHRFLADSYRALPRHEIARVSELLQSQLLQPLNITPLQPQLAESNLAILESAGPARPSFNEYNSLFLRNRFALQASGVVGSNDILGDELVHSAVWNRLSYSIGQFYYQTDGIRENNDQQKSIYNAYIQGMVSPRTSVMSEVRYRKDDYGDLTLLFDPQIYSPTIRQETESKSLRIGGRHDFQPHSTIIGTAIFGDTDHTVEGLEEYGVPIEIGAISDSIMVEAQHLYSGNRFRLQTGAGYLSSDETESFYLGFPVDNLTEDDSTVRHGNIYAYGQVDIPYDVTATIGLSGDYLEDPSKDREQLNPKFGIIWNPAENTQVRGAIFRTMQRRLVYAQTVEPTHVAGFNQFFDDASATSAWIYGLGVDQTFSDDIFGGIQFYHRDLNVPLTRLLVPSGIPVPMEDDWQEDIGSAYVYWAPAHWVTLGCEYFYEKFTHDTLGGPDGIKNLTTHRLKPKVYFFHSSGFTARLEASYVDQQGDFGFEWTGYYPDSDQFWLVDLGLSYRLPKRYGIVNFTVKNLFDEEFLYLDTDPANPRYLPEQQVMLSLTVSL